MSKDHPGMFRNSASSFRMQLSDVASPVKYAVIIGLFAGLIGGLIGAVDAGSVFWQGFWSGVTATLYGLSIYFFFNQDLRHRVTTAFIPFAIASIIVVLVFPSYSY